MKKEKYVYTKEMDEISGFGGGYEKICRDMVIAGLKWLDNNPNADISYKEFKNIYGLTADESKDCQVMQEEMLKASGDDCTGAMMQSTLNHVMYIHKNGWDKYVQEMSKKKVKTEEE